MFYTGFALGRTLAFGRRARRRARRRAPFSILKAAAWQRTAAGDELRSFCAKTIRL